MKETVTLLLNIARKSYLGADFKQTIIYALQAKEMAEGKEWLEAQKYLLGCYRELLEDDSLRVVQDELLVYSRSTEDRFRSFSFYLLAQAYGYHGEWAKAKGCIEESLRYSLLFQDFDDVAYALYGVARIDAYQGGFSKAFEGLEKLESILNVRPRSEIQMSLLLLKSYVYRKLGNTDLALKVAWASYEEAKKGGLFVYVPIILAALAALEFERGAFSEAQFYLSLAEKGVVSDKQPALFNFLSAERRRLDKVIPKSEFDLVVDMHSRVIHEKEKGIVDFKNQHTLLDLALLLLKNPQKNFGKEDLLREVWGRQYSPGSDDNLVYVNIKRLRSLIEPNPDNPKYILRNRAGYYFDNSHKLFFKSEEKAV